MTVNVVKCEKCGATSSLEPNIQSAGCPYCTTPLVVNNAKEESIIKPSSLLPFKINKNEARAFFEKWVKSLWFAPNQLKKAHLLLDKFKAFISPSGLTTQHGNKLYRSARHILLCFRNIYNNRKRKISYQNKTGKKNSLDNSKRTRDKHVR